MPYTTLVAGTTITSSWANANVRDQAVTPFSNAASRSASITSPVNGMIGTLTAADATNGIYHYNGTSWRQPWNMPWGYQTTLTSSTTAAYNNASSNALATSSTFTFITNRRYLLFYTVENQNNSAGGTVNTYTAQVQTATGTFDNATVGRETPTTGVNAQTIWNMVTVYTCTAGAAGTPRIVGSTSLSGTNQTLTGLVVRIIDDGPSGAPV